MRIGQKIFLREEFLKYQQKKGISINKKVHLKEIIDGFHFPYKVSDEGGELLTIGDEDIDYELTVELEPLKPPHGMVSRLKKYFGH